MIRTLSVLLAAASISTVAAAESFTEFEAELEFDRAGITTEAGAAKTLRSLNLQARGYCQRLSFVSVGFGVDQVCVKDLVRQAVTKIDAEALERVYAESPLYVETVSARFAKLER